MNKIKQTSKNKVGNNMSILDEKLNKKKSTKQNTENEHHCKDCENTNCFLRKLPPNWLDWVETKKFVVKVPKKQHIFRENDAVKGIYFIQEGKVKIFSTGLKGKEKIVRLAKKGDILGHRGLGAEAYPISAVTLSDTILYFIDNDSLFELFMANPYFTYSLMMYYSKELRTVELHAKYNSQMSTIERIIQAILYTKETFGINPDTGVIDVDLTRVEIASIADTSYEEVSRVLKQLEEKNLIIKKAKGLHLVDEAKLYELIEEYGIHN